MRFRGKLSEADVNDVRRVVRSKWCWLKLLAANRYGAALLVGLVWATIAGLVRSTHPNWTALGIMWLVVGGILAWAFYSTKRSTAKEFSDLNATLPEWISLDSGGINVDGPNGAKAFQPWGNFKGWREGHRVILLEMQGEAFVILPAAELSEVEREALRQLIRSHISSYEAVSVH